MKNELLEALQWRYATKKYDSSFTLSQDDLSVLESIIGLTPSSYGLQPLKYIWIQDPSLRQKVQSIAMNQQQITDAAAVLIICAHNNLDASFLDAHADNMRDTRQIEEAQIAGFRAHLHQSIGKMDGQAIRSWNSKQAYIVLGQLLTACAILKLDATPMEGFDPQALDLQLGLDQRGLHSVLICTIGRRAKDDSYQFVKKVRRDKKSIFEQI
jgi:nitroreductase/dihydropteridine reductase